MATDLANDPPSPNQTTANPAPTTLNSGNVDRIVVSDAVTAAPSTAVSVEHSTSGTPVAAANAAAAFGVRIEFKLDDTVNVKQLAGAIGAFWRAVNSAIGGDSGVVSIMAQSSGALVEYRFNDYAFQTVNGSVTNPAHGFTSDNRHGMSLDAGNRVFLGHTSVECIAVDSSAGAPRVAFLGKVATPAAAATGGVLTAGGAYTANEQSMIQKAYDCLRTFGLLT